MRDLNKYVSTICSRNLTPHATVAHRCRDMFVPQWNSMAQRSKLHRQTILLSTIICPHTYMCLRSSACIWLHHSLTQSDFQNFQYPQSGRLPRSLIFLDMTSFIIHPSTAPLISSLSATHSSHVSLSVASPFSQNHLLFTSSTYAMSLLLSVSLIHVHTFTSLIIHRCRSPMIYRAIQCHACSIDCLSERCNLSGVGLALFDAFSFWLVTDTAHKVIIC